MMKKIFLIGTEHKYQKQDVERSWEDAQAFQSFLLRACHQCRIKTVAEELNPQALEEAKKRWQNLKKVVEGYNKNGGYIKEVKEHRKEALQVIEEALKWHKEGMSIPQLAAKPPRKHLFCDPDWEERKERKIRYVGHLRNKMDDSSIATDEKKKIKRQIRKEDRKRELYWLERLRLKVPESEWPVLFICGADHVKTFSRILKENDFDVKHIDDDWEPSIPTERE